MTNNEQIKCYEIVRETITRQVFRTIYARDEKEALDLWRKGTGELIVELEDSSSETYAEEI